MTRLWLVAIALLIGVGVVAAENILFASLTGHPLESPSEVELFRAMLVAIPYLGLALAGARRPLPWIIGLALTLPLQGYYLYSGVSYQLNPDAHGGVNIGLGLIMILAPFILLPIVLCVHENEVKRRATRS